MEQTHHVSSQKKKYLSPSQLKAIEYFIRGCNVSEVADNIGMCRETVSKWQRLPHFQEELQHQKDLLFESIRDSLTSLTLEAIKSVRDNMGCYKIARTGLAVLDKVGKVLIDKS